MHKLRFAALALSGAAFMVASPPAWGAGFALKEQSGSAQGNAFAGATAGAEDISYMFFNPAGLTRHSGTRIMAGVSYIRPQIEPSNMEGQTVLATPIAGGDGGSDVGEDAFVPNFYGLHSLSDRLKLGIGVNVPFGLESNYDRDWVGRYHAVKSELLTVNINPNIAYRLTDQFSVGAGLQAQYVDAELSNAIDFGTIGAASGIPGSMPAQQDGFAEVEGDDWGVGFTLGALFEVREGTRLGVGYRSQVAHELTGDARFETDEAGVGAALQAGGLFTDTGARANVKTPDTLTGGLYHELTPQIAVMGEVQWTRWSKFEELRVRFDNPDQPDSVTTQDWDDTIFLAAGATYRPSDRWALRVGYAFDESPVPDETRTPRIPGSDRHWLSAGARFQPVPGVTLDAAYTRIFMRDSHLDLRAADPENTFRGDLSGDFDSHVDILAIQARVDF